MVMSSFAPSVFLNNVVYRLVSVGMRGEGRKPLPYTGLQWDAVGNLSVIRY